MSYKAYITKLENVRPHPNADKLLLGDCFGNTICLDLSYHQGEIGVYFPEGGQLSEEFCEHNNLLRKKDENGNNIGGYLDPEKRNIKTIRLRGEKSDGLFLPLQCLQYTGVNFDDLNTGDIITIVNGHEICTKYIPGGNSRNKKANTKWNKNSKKTAPIAPLFKEHLDTEQLAYNIEQFKVGDIIDMTLKMHGTSQRTGYLPILIGYSDGIINKISNFFRKKMGRDIVHKGKPIYEYGYISGSRRVVLNKRDNSGYYGSNDFRYEQEKKLIGKLNKGEEIYYEVVGYVNDKTTIMPVIDIKDKELKKQYGNKMVFSYGCNPGEAEMYVYRMTMTNEDGVVVEYTPDYMRYRCEQMGIKCVPHIKTFILKAEDDIKQIAETYHDGVDPIGKTHIREGVVLRILNRPKFTAYKHKNDNFKILSGIAIEKVSEEKENCLSNDILSEI